MADHLNAMTVELAGRRYTVSWLRKNPALVGSVFARARAEVGHGVCLCRPDRRLRLVIRLRKSRYHLAVWPGEGPLHASGCEFHDHEPHRGGSNSRRAAAIDAEAGTIRLNTALSTRDSSAGALAEAPRPAGRSGTGVQRARTGLLGLIHHLWEQADLHTWPGSGGPRGWAHCHQALVQAAEPLTVNRQRLREVLHVVEPYHPSSESTITARLGAWRTGLVATSRRGLLLGEIKPAENGDVVAPTRYGVGMRLRHLAPLLYLSEALWERARHRYRFALADRAPARARRIVIAAVEVTRGGHLQAVDAAVLLACSRYLPADSGHEVVMSQALAEAGRAFVKPLRPAPGEDVLPDFVLTDTPPPGCVVEVWGMLDDPEYEAHQLAKLARYREQGRTVIEWDVREPLPRPELAR
ncbi:DUF1173 family protein (plasmid) [Nocardiopsis flavescens]|nr:DUF1173 family protein [Nocardiopsis flavescens]